MKKVISTQIILCLLAVSLSGCGSTDTAEATQAIAAPVQETSGVQEMPEQEQPSMEAPEMEIPELSEEEIDMLLQAGLDAAGEESELWSVTQITDSETLRELTQFADAGEAPSGERPENMPSREGEDGQSPGDSIPAKRDGGNQSMGENFPEGETPEKEKPADKGGDRQSGNRGGGMTALTILISRMEGADITAEDIFAKIEEAAQSLGYSAFSMEVTEEQVQMLDYADGYTPNLIVRIMSASRT